jgi:phenylalanyl-tRNA synthetase beta chain
MKISRNWLQKYFDQPLPSADELDHALTFHAFEIEEVEEKNGDSIIDVKILANRAADCLSHRGVAKEFSAILNIPLKDDLFREELPSRNASGLLTVSIDDPTLCNRYIGAVIQNVKVGPSPDWLKTALENVGQRSINNVVDATNYVMLDLGQPLHAFDADKLTQKDGGWHVRVRNAKEGEKITTLSSEERTLSTENLLITDGTTDTILGVAGVKGGKAAEVTEATTTIILEAAHFNYASIRKTAQKLRLPTDASKRFENNIAPFTAGFGMHAAIALILEIAGGNCEGVVDTNGTTPPSRIVLVDRAKINRHLGTILSREHIADALVRLGLPFEEKNEIYTVTVPFERVDLTIPEDLVEEVGRIVGYENVTAAPIPPLESPVSINKRLYYAHKIRQMLTTLGFDEVMTYAMQEKGVVEIANPIASDKAFLRPSLQKGVVAALQSNVANAPLLGRDSVLIFEIGSVFTGAQESVHVALVSGARKKPAAALDAAISAIAAAVGVPVALITTEDAYREFDLDTLVAQLPEPTAYDVFPVVTDGGKYKTIHPYPFALRDIAFWAPEETTPHSVSVLITESAGPYLVRLDQFDEFKKEGRVSYAFHLVFQSPTKTLEDEEIVAAMNSVTEALKQAGFEVR